jgi:hypothetical protein
LRIEAILIIPCISVLLSAEVRPNSKIKSRSAIVCQLEGQVHIANVSEDQREIAIHDWMVDGSVIQTGATGRVVLIFKGGERFALERNSRGSVSSSGIRLLHGSVHRLGPVPMIPTMANTTVFAVKGNPGAMIVRGDLDTPARFRDIHPVIGGSVIANNAVLSFASKEPIGNYQVKIFDSNGSEVFSASGKSTRYQLVPGVLIPGATYTWEVGQIGTSPSETMRAMFKTVSPEHAEVRQRLQVLVEHKGDPELLILLEAMDRWLGLQ